MYKIVIIDDEKGMLHFLKKLFEINKFQVFAFETGESGIDFIKENRVDTVLLDVRLPDISGEEVLKEIKLINENLPVVIMTAYGDIDGAVEFVKSGAYDYVTKPFPKEKILEVIKNSCEKYSLLRENYQLKKALISKSFSPDEIIYKSKIMSDILNLAKKVAQTDVTILLEGESGTGKELFAKLIHYHSSRADKIFFPVNCSNFSENLFESHFFGHYKGAFTGAVKSEKGILKEIDGGTLFLDEITEIPNKIQSKLLRLLQNKEFIPVGSSKVEFSDIRIIAATNKNLKDEVLKGNFRKDLYYRLNVMSLNIPSLKERKEDIKPLIIHFIKKFSVKFNKVVRGISDDALKLLQQYEFPGNVRELENLIERAVILTNEDTIGCEFFPIDFANICDSQYDMQKILPLDDVIRNYIYRIYLFTGKNKQQTADILKVSRKTVARKLKELEIVE